MSLDLVILNPVDYRRKEPRAMAKKVETKKPKNKSSGTKPSGSRRSKFGGEGGLFSRGNLERVGGVTGGFIAAATLPNLLPVDELKSGWGRFGAKVGIGLLFGMVLRRVLKPRLANSLGAGALCSAGVDLWNTYGPADYRLGAGISGYFSRPAGLPLLGYDDPSLAGSADSSLDFTMNPLLT